MPTNGKRAHLGSLTPHWLATIRFAGVLPHREMVPGLATAPTMGLPPIERLSGVKRHQELTSLCSFPENKPPIRPRGAFPIPARSSPRASCYWSLRAPAIRCYCSSTHRPAVRSLANSVRAATPRTPLCCPSERAGWTPESPSRRRPRSAGFAFRHLQRSHCRPAPRAPCPLINRP